LSLVVSFLFLVIEVTLSTLAFLVIASTFLSFKIVEFLVLTLGVVSLSTVEFLVLTLGVVSLSTVEFLVDIVLSLGPFFLMLPP
jgi:hypothetical protein